MASTISYLTISCSRASLFRHWALVIVLCSLLSANNLIFFAVNAEPSFTLHAMPLSVHLNHSDSNEIQITPWTNLSFHRNPLVRIPLKNLPKINETKVLLTISSPQDLAFDNFVIEISNPPSSGNEDIVKTRVQISKATLYSFLGVSVTNLCAVVGFVCIPIQRCRHFPLVLSFMISLAVSALLSTAVLVLIPESMRMVDMPLEFGGQGRAYLFKFSCVPAGVLFFFIVEYVLLVLPRISKWNVFSDKVESVSDANVEESKNWDETSDFPNLEASAGDVQVHDKDDSHSTYSVYASQKSLAFPRRRLCFRFDRERYSKIAPVAWMILFGDAFHNFMDGMTIAVGFTESPSIGIALTLSILFEELPSELGDFAILISSGFSVKEAVCANFLSACCSYLGLILGVVIGEVSVGALYVFSITSGFFLYISLSDMLPKLREALEELENEKKTSIFLFFVQLAGMLIGFGFVLGITLISDYIVL